MNFYSRPCGRGDGAPLQASRPAGQFLLTPLREGRPDAALQTDREDWISTHAPAGGATDGKFHIPLTQQEFLLTPLREGRPRAGGRNDGNEDHFYSRPCGRGDFVGLQLVNVDHFISTHAPAGGATAACRGHSRPAEHFYSRPCGRGDLKNRVRTSGSEYFYSRPCGRGDDLEREQKLAAKISTHAPAGGATADLRRCWKHRPHFYSRPCGRGDQMSGLRFESMAISTHAPAGGATRRRDNRKGAYTIFLLTPLREGRPARKTESRNL